MVNGTGLLRAPLTFTTTLPVVAPDGTETVTLLLPQALAVAARPLNVTVLEPCGFPNPLPEMVIGNPASPSLRESPEITGLGSTVKLAPFDELPNDVTTTLPVVAPTGGYTTI